MSLKGRVIKSTGSQYWVKDESGEVHVCTLKGNIRLRDYKFTNPVVVGDEVKFLATTFGEGVIEGVHKRKNYLIRRSIKLSKQSHIIASNIDQAILVVTLSHPKTHLEFIDRYLVSAGAYHIPAILVINKMDLYGKKEVAKSNEISALYSSIGYACMQVSALEDKELTLFEGILNGKTSLISGHSGVGKSSLLNRVDPDLKLKTAEISAYHKTGKHTTTYAEMHPVKDFGFVIDTPGIKGLGIIDIAREEISHYFPEMLKVLPKCKFNNCVHIDEPQCAVKEAFERGEIADSRYRSYLSIYFEDEGSYRKDPYK